ncbi:hypothetical protein K7X08_032061 [Anisodus acutangulus]|uniref:Uncharacterized protein n=1 Tax=Anisodus acutangulus TaxID=402998 RepID=A0A9Q1MR90_9SOLA|nr:hypothetical protein K7X08_032061 [Anisodus acutangulus]
MLSYTCLASEHGEYECMRIHEDILFFSIILEQEIKKLSTQNLKLQFFCENNMTITKHQLKLFSQLQSQELKKMVAC